MKQHTQKLRNEVTLMSTTDTNTPNTRAGRPLTNRIGINSQTITSTPPPQKYQNKQTTINIKKGPSLHFSFLFLLIFSMAQKEKEKYNNRVTDGRNFILDARLPLSADGPPISRSTNSFSHFQFKAFFHKINEFCWPGFDILRL